MGFNFPPKDWAACNGQTMEIQQHQIVFALLGTRYGGNGTSNFKLPDYQGRIPLHPESDAGFYQGRSGGFETVKLEEYNMPNHTHLLNVAPVDANNSMPKGMYVAQGKNVTPFHAPPKANSTQLYSGSVSTVGGGKAHNNMQPYQVVNFCIALDGLYPPRS